MVPIPKFNLNEINASWPATPHPAFIVNGATIPVIYISKYQNIVQDGRAYSLPMRDPRALITFDAAKAACEAKGAGWHLMSNAEWAAIALWCRANSCMPHGNNNYGKDVNFPAEKGIQTTTDGVDGSGNARVGHVATGSGPVTWSHDGTTKGVWDMNGNVHEWVTGYRLVSGEIQLIQDNNSALAVDETSSSTLWKAVLQDGSLVAPGSVGTLKWDYTTAPPAAGTATYGFRLNTSTSNQADNDTAHGAQTFQSITTAPSITAPDRLKYLALYPADNGDHGGDYIYMRNRPGMERLAIRGGGWLDGANAGVFYCNANGPRSGSSTYVGFRSAFIPI